MGCLHKLHLNTAWREPLNSPLSHLNRKATSGKGFQWKYLNLKYEIIRDEQGGFANTWVWEENNWKAKPLNKPHHLEIVAVMWCVRWEASKNTSSVKTVLFRKNKYILMPYICLRIQTSTNFQHNTLEEWEVPYGMETTDSSRAGAVTEVFRTLHFQEHKVSGMSLPTPLQLHLNLGMSLQNYITYSLLLSPSGKIWRTSFIYLCLPCSWAWHTIWKVSAELHFV